jgi:antitoxin YqcF
MAISNDNKAISKVLIDAFRGTPKYTRYADEPKKSTIDILSCIDSPWEGITSHGTLGLSDYSIGKVVDNVPLRVEFVSACQSEVDFFPNILATCAFNIINSHFKCEPGSIYTDVVETYAKSPMKHILFTNPFLWEDKLNTLYLQPRKIVAWLLLVPISDEELGYAEVKGTKALEDLFEKEQIDIFDLLRKSVI